MKWIFLPLLFFSLSAFAFEPKVDDSFITSVVNKSVAFRPKGEGSTALPNCVATTLRAGGFLPVFAGSDTDYFYNTLIPGCFSPSENPMRGDIGILVYLHGEKTRFAHSVLFLDSDRIFEKPSPNFEDKFRFNSWVKIRSNNTDPHLQFAVLRFKKNQNCPLNTFSEFYDSLTKDDPIKRLSVMSEKRIQRQNWRIATRKERALIAQVASLQSSSQSEAVDRIVHEMLSIFKGLFNAKPGRDLSGKHEDLHK